MRKGSLIGLVFSLCTAVSGWALPPNLRTTEAKDTVSVFRHWSTAQGLAQSWVTAVEQGPSGQMWIGTNNGLSRFDGHHWFNYLYSAEIPESLPDNSIYDLLQDSQGRLWVVTPGGVAQYNPRRDTFWLRLSAHRTKKLGMGTLYGVKEDRRGMLWFLADGGVLAYDASSDRIQAYPIGSKKLPAKEISRLFRLPDGTLLLADYRKALYRYDRHKDRWQLWLDLTKPKWKLRPAQREVRDLLALPDGTIWAATASGLVEVSQDGKVIGVLEPGDVNWMPSSRINDLARVGKEIWLGTEEHGLYRVRDDGSVLHVVHEADNGLSLPRSPISVIKPTHSGQVWLGTRGDGALLWNAKSEIVQRILPGTGGIVNQVVWGFLERQDGDLWIAGDRGIDVWDWASGLQRHLSFGKVSEGREPRQVFAMAAWNDQVFAATTDGVWQIDPKRYSVRRLPTRWKGEGSEQGEQVVFSLFADDNGLWIGYDNGWEYWTPDTSWLSTGIEENGCRQGVMAWIQTSTGLLMGGEKAVCRLNLDRREAAPLQGLTRIKAPGSGSAVTAFGLHEGRLYVGYSGLGLVEYDLDRSRVLHRWRLDNGLPSDNVSSILIDDEQRMWIATQTGLTIFDPKTASYRRLTELDGLNDNEFNEGAYLRLSNGAFLFGTIRGVVAISPSRLLGRESLPIVIPTRIEALATGTYLDPHALLEIDENRSALAIHYSALDFYHPEDMRYQYRLLGKNSAWVDLGNKSQLVFGNFDSGRHLLLLRARRSGQTDWGPVTRVSMHVLPPWWRSGWALAGYLLLALLVSGTFVFYRWRLVKARTEAMQRLVASEEKLRLALDASGQGHWQWQRDGDVILLERTQEVLGINLPPRLPLLEFWGRIHARDRLSLVTAWKDFLFGLTDVFHADCRVDIGNASIWMELRGQAVERSGDGMASKVLGTYRNVTVEKEKDARLDLLARAFEDTSEGVVVLDEQRRIIEVNDAALQLSGVTREQLVGRQAESLRGSRQRPEDYEAVWEEMARSGKWQGELWVRTLLGEEKPLWVSLSTLDDPSKEERHYVAVFSDMSERKAAEEELKFLANYDPLTQLPNRALLWDRLGHALETAKRENCPLALMFLDLDHFKRINDTYGHGAGDKVLIAIADRLRATLRDDDTIARIAGDEFVIILENFPHLGAIPAVTDKIRRAMERPIEVEGRQLNVSFSVGVALYPGDGEDAMSLMKSADIAMYNAKQAGRNRLQFFAPEMQERVRQRLEIGSDLRHALKRGELEAWYQPQIYQEPALGDDGVRLAGFEALMRWRHKTRGLVSPGMFIPVAEESDLINEIGLWIFEQALQQYLIWKDKFGFSGSLSVNLSARQLRIPNLAGDFSAMLKASGIDHGKIVLEVTETAFLESVDEAKRKLASLREAGFSIALDDFGSGYSSLNYLRQLPIDIIKIDASFVQNLLESAVDRAIVTAVLEIARVQGLRVLAEGIERVEQKDLLLALGCRYFQGFLFGRPAPAAELAEWLNRPKEKNEPSE